MNGVEDQAPGRAGVWGLPPPPTTFKLFVLELCRLYLSNQIGNIHFPSPFLSLEPGRAQRVRTCAEEVNGDHHQTRENVIRTNVLIELKLELIPTQMTQKPILREEDDAHALRASQNVTRA